MFQRTFGPLSRIIPGAAFILTLGLAESIYGDITGQSVVVGNATFTQTATGWIIKPSNGAIIEYTTFGVNSNETIKFIQANANARVLNRVLGDFPTNIDGRLIANGIVYITNPAGVFIGANGVVNVGGIYAAAGNMSNDDFINGSNSFTGMSGRIENAGSVNAKSVAAFMATSIVNTGSIQSGPNGLTALVASTGTVRLVEASADPKVFVEAVISSDPMAVPSSSVGVLNSGSVKSGLGGQVLLGAGDVYSIAIRNTATSAVRTPDGMVYMQGGVIEQEGLIRGERLTVIADRFDLSTDLRFDRLRINSNVTLHNDVTVSGENGGQAEWMYVQGKLQSAAEEFHSFTSRSNENVFNTVIGHGQGRLGSLTLGGNAYFGGNVTTRDDITIAGKTLFNNGNREQFITSTEGIIDFGDLFFKLGSSLTVSAHTIELGGGGFAVGDLNLGTSPETSIILNGSGEQRIGSHTKVSIDGDLAKTTAGAFYIGAPLIQTTGDVSTTAGDIRFAGSTIFNGAGDQVATANGGELYFFDEAAKTTAGSLELGGTRIHFAKNISTAAGGLSFLGDTLFEGFGDQQAIANGGALTATGDVDKPGAGALTLKGTALTLGGNVSTSDGNLTLDGPVTFDGAGDQSAIANGGTLEIGGDVVKEAAGDLLLSSDGALSLDGDVRVLDGSLSLDATSIALTGSDTQVLSSTGTTEFNSDITKGAGNLTITGDDRIEIGGDVTVEGGRLRFNGPMLLKLDTSMSAMRVTFDGSIDGTYALVVAADERITFLGDIGQNSLGEKGGSDGLQSLTLSAGDFVEFESGAVRVVDEISFNANDPVGGPIPNVATIGAAGDITFDCGEFTMGPRQKFTVLGTLTINAGAGTVTLGDVNALGDLVVNADSIQLRSRAGGAVLGPNGSVNDSGADLIAGGSFVFSSIPLVLGGGVVQFGSLLANADTTGNLAGFTLSLLDGPFGAASLRQGSLYFDATVPQFTPAPPTPPTPTSNVSPATFLAVEDPNAAEDTLEGDRAILRENERLAVNRTLGPAVSLRRQLPVEIERGGDGRVAFDAGALAEVGRVDGARFEVALPRISRPAAVRFLSASARLESLVDTDAKRERAAALLAKLEAATTLAHVGAFTQTLRESGDATDLAVVQAIAGTVRWGEAIGLTDAERSAAGNGATPFPQSRVASLLGLTECSLRSERFGPGFWAIAPAPTTVAQR